MRANAITEYVAKLWHSYEIYAQAATTRRTESELSDITLLQERLFTTISIYFIPVSFIALVPGVWMALKDHIYSIAFFDILSVVAIVVVIFNRYLSLTLKKTFIIGIIYALAVFLIALFGFLGPGFIYLLAITIFVTLIFTGRLAAYLSVVLHFLTCAAFTIIINFKLFNSPLINSYTTGSWIAFSSNLIFLSLVCVLLIRKIMYGLERTILSERLLQNSLKSHMDAVELQNTKLRDIAFIQSHVVRSPLARIMGLVDLLQGDECNTAERELLTYLDQSAKEFDSIIKTISENADTFE
jgi:signal transduction histidine kinase